LRIESARFPPLDRHTRTAHSVVAQNLLLKWKGNAHLVNKKMPSPLRYPDQWLSFSTSTFAINRQIAAGVTFRVPFGI
jgi:hypothetical protein